jgi:hypothetical protein
MPPHGPWERVPLFQFLYSIAGLIVGVICVIGGIVLFLHGILGSSSWVGSFLGAQTKLADAAPGTILFVVGLFVIWVTRFDMQVGDSSRKRLKRRD